MDPKRNKTRHFYPRTVFPSAAILCMLPLGAFATVKPALEQMVERSDVVAVGYVRRYSPNDQAVILKISRVLKHDAFTSKKVRMEINLIYEPPFKGGIDWNYFIESQEECLFFLKRTKVGSLTVSDSLFGAERMSGSLRRELEELGLGEASIRWTRIGGMVLFFIAVNVFIAAVVKMGSNKPGSTAGKK
ncbi:MAG: hypothetical protein O3B01_29775 [Planctomycetota bacterium]|nr:hypothetical protein [Planctomycetota bacterium]MDA1142772.1 hypothetical protein [Planctomycetota bacterium]